MNVGVVVEIVVCFEGKLLDEDLMIPAADEPDLQVFVKTEYEKVGDVAV